MIDRPDAYVYLITALLPLAASMLVFQVNPYHALVIRGILGAIAALLYTVLGAADVALTEALVGTLLAIMLYAVAVRSSMVLRLGALTGTSGDRHFSVFLDDLQNLFSPYHLRVEVVYCLDSRELYRSLIDCNVHVICGQSPSRPPDEISPDYPQEKLPADQQNSYKTVTRLHRLHEIMQIQLPSAEWIDIHAIDMNAIESSRDSLFNLGSLDSGSSNSGSFDAGEVKP
ncbi:MAG: DUF4040 domain-containing protein [Synechococcales cyanobacterium RU_4_20]|nr:DUF4040 domain-containing protein [Synechococcales cyanobacterium RU_4_20]NJR70135.1 DUF4040 domain-containing protein [Synechococcales cyanobacterium CRU_2_2]